MARIIPPCAVGWSAVLGVVTSACTNGGGSEGGSPPIGFAVAELQPARGAWVGSDVVPSVRLTREVEKASVGPDAMRLFTAGGQRVEASLEVSGNTLRLRPTQALADGEYVYLFELDVRAVDGSSLRLVTPAPIEFSVRPISIVWAPPVTLGPSTDSSVQPAFASDAIGGASLAWIHTGQLMVADFDRDRGWQQATVVDLVGASAPMAVLLARGAGTVAVAMVYSGFFGGASTMLRVLVSERFDRTGARIWNPPGVLVADTVTEPQLHVTGIGQPYVLTASTRRANTEVRVHWVDSRGVFDEEIISRFAPAFTIDAVANGVRGEVAVAWTQTEGSARAHYVRVHRQLGWDPVLALAQAPSRLGLGVDGNAWALVPEVPSRMIYLAQDNEQWGSARPAVAAGFAALVGRERDLLVLDWVADGGQETLVSRQYDRLGQPRAAPVLAGPTSAPIQHLLYAGDPDSEVFAAWREGQTIVGARRSGATSTWSPSAPWREDYAPVPIERAQVTIAGNRIWLTWVDADRLVTTNLTPLRPASRPRANVRASASATPLLDEQLYGTAGGALLVVWREGDLLRAQDVRD